MNDPFNPDPVLSEFEQRSCNAVLPWLCFRDTVPRSISVNPSAARASPVFLSMFSRHRLASCGSSNSLAFKQTTHQPIRSTGVCANITGVNELYLCEQHERIVCAQVLLQKLHTMGLQSRNGVFLSGVESRHHRLGSDLNLIRVQEPGENVIIYKSEAFWNVHAYWEKHSYLSNERNAAASTSGRSISVDVVAMPPLNMASNTALPTARTNLQW